MIPAYKILSFITNEEFILNTVANQVTTFTAILTTLDEVFGTYYNCNKTLIL